MRSGLTVCPMTDEHPDRAASTDHGDTGPAGGDRPGDSDSPGDSDGPAGGRRSGARTAAWAVLRAAVVLAVAGLLYALVVPYPVVERSRLARLVPDHPGLAAFDRTKAQRGEQADTTTGLAALTAAARREPGRTGVYSIEWAASPTSAVGVIAFLLPDAASAAATGKQVATQQLAAGSYAADSLRRSSTFTVAGVPGSQGAVYVPAAKTAGGPPGLAVTVFRSGRVVAVTEVAGAPSGSGSAAGTGDASTVARTELARLQAAGPGFGLEVTRYPALATALWAAAAVVLAALAALGPVAARRRADRRRAAHEAELANRVQVGNRVITKRRA